MFACPIIVPPKSPLSDDIPVEVNEYDIIVMSQSCDLAAKKISLVLVCPLWSLALFEKKNLHYGTVKGKEELRKGYVAGNHLLNKCDLSDYKLELSVVDFRSVYSVDREFLEYLASTNGSRLRLLPPYREHLAQAFARFFMRVGLPTDIPEFKK